MAICFSATGCVTYTGSGDTWFGKEQALAESNAMGRKGMAPVSIDCRIEDASGPERPIYSTKIKYAANPNRNRWRYGVGEADEMQVYANDAAREKLKLVMRKRIVDVESGKKASCAIWRGPAKS